MMKWVLGLLILSGAAYAQDVPRDVVKPQYEVDTMAVWDQQTRVPQLQGHASGYALGILEMAFAGKAACIPPDGTDISVTQKFSQAIAAHMKEHPEDAEKAAPWVFLQVAHDTFPCGRI